ncbi:hypothetical protein SAMN05421854_1161, partial [Amycolatopsis rubida]
MDSVVWRAVLGEAFARIAGRFGRVVARRGAARFV